MNDRAPTERTRVRRLHERGAYDRETINAIIDEALICHVAFDYDGEPSIIPTACWREGDHVYIHGSSKSRMLTALRDGAPCSIAVTHLDGLVLARSAFHHSMNFRSVVLYGHAQEVTDPDRKMLSLERFVEKIAPGRWDEIRGPDPQEFKATLVLSMPIDEASAKIRTGPPVDDEPDMALPVWAGVVPLEMVGRAPIGDPQQPADRPVPDHANRLVENKG